MEFRELFAVDSKVTLNFFYQNLKEGMDLPAFLSDDETLHVSRVLARYAQHSVGGLVGSSSPLRDLTEFFDEFVLKPGPNKHPELIVSACTQNLFLNGFMRDQMERRHNVKYYDQIGHEHYWEACNRAKVEEMKLLYGRMASHFPLWTIICRDLHRKLRENSNNRYLLHLQ